MQDDQVVEADEAVELTTEEPTADAEGASEDSQLAAAVDAQAADSSGAAAEKAPEVPDDARDRIARAQEHLADVDLDADRKAADRLT